MQIKNPFLRFLAGGLALAILAGLSFLFIKSVLMVWDALEPIRFSPIWLTVHDIGLPILIIFLLCLAVGEWLFGVRKK